jgi:DNA replication protein DnaC
MTELSEKLDRIGLKISEDVLRPLLDHATKKKLSHVQFLEQLVELEGRERETRNLARRTRGATLGSFKTLDRFDWNHPRTIDRNLYEQLHESLDFIARGENVLLRGQAGVGKTTLAQNLGHRALQRGYSVRFSTLPAALADLLRQESLPATERRLKRYTQPELLVLDELGYVPCVARAADLLFHIISRRLDVRSVVITTNLAFKQWGNVFHDAPCLSALIDRFAQHCHILDIDAESWRDKERQLRKKKKKSPSKTHRSRT